MITSSLRPKPTTGSTSSQTSDIRTVVEFEWDDLPYWDSGEFQVIQERHEDLLNKKKVLNPSRENLFAALDATPWHKTKVMFCGQDPYPAHKYCTGLAFSIPPSIPKGEFPVTLRLILEEYQSDLGLPEPITGDLTSWANQGVLLWNAIPSCEEGKSLSHYWPEWMDLTTAIVKKLSERGIVFVFLGSVARDFSGLVDKLRNCAVIETSHPSPRGVKFGKNPFLGSRVFSRINAELVDLGLDPIDWRLPHANNIRIRE